MGKVHKVGFIGFGFIGKVHAYKLGQTPVQGIVCHGNRIYLEQRVHGRKCWKLGKSTQKNGVGAG